MQPEQPIVDPRAKRRRGPMMAVAAGVVALAVLGGGAAVALRLWYGSTGTLPEEVVPAATAAFARINLTPGYSQRLKFEALLAKFSPSASGGGNGNGKALDELKRSFLHDLDAQVPYEEVSSWFGDRLGVGLWTESSRRPVVLLALASKDDAKARQTLTKVREESGTDRFGFTVSAGYALVARAEHDSQAAADAAAAAARKGTLASNPDFRAALAGLPADQALIGWADLAQTSALATAMVTDQAKELGPADAAPAVPGLQQRKGFVVTGVKAVDNGIEIRSRAIGTEPSTVTTTDIRPQLDALPKDCAVAAVVSGGMSDLAAFGPLTGMLWGGASFVPLGGVVMGLSVDVTRAPGFDPGQDIPDYPGLTPEEKQQLEEASRTTKASQALLGALGSARTVSLAVTGVRDHGDPLLMLTLQLSDTAAAQKLHGDLDGLVRSGDVLTRQQGDRVDVWSKGYAAGQGRLADSPLYREAMAGTPAAPTGAVYIDVQKLMTTGAKKQFAPVKAISFVTARHGDEVDGVGRIVIR
jgi:hypothetical protein